MAFSGDLARLYSKFLEGDRPVHERLTELVLEYCTERQACGVGEGGDDDITVVSLGDGTGEPGLRVAKRLRESVQKGQQNVKVFSTDVSDDMNRQARERAESEGLLSLIHNDKLEASSPHVQVQFLQLSADSETDLRQHFLDHSVDIVVMSFSLMFVPDKGKCMSEIARILKPGGRAIFAVLRRFAMIGMMEQALQTIDVFGNPKVQVANCLALKEEGSIETLLQNMFVAQNKKSTLAVHTSEILEYTPYLSTDEEEVLDMFCTFVDADGWEEAQRNRDDARKCVRKEILKCMQTGEGWIVAEEEGLTKQYFQCPDCAAFILTAVRDAES